ncbi:MAG: HEAT repeat domain-containing protein [Deltaproteobacteria bacterium]|nr:HEAT repeat domain-containing protein [Deltaproteobacteria bacterium]
MAATDFKRRIISRLKTEPLDAVLAEVRRLPPRKAVSPLIAGLSHASGNVKWHAVSALGLVIAMLAREDMEAARNIMRRLMWSLNDESGNIGWGVPEAMAEIMANHEGLAEEYAHILVSYMREDGSYLELLPLQRGLMWGIGRLAETRPELLKKWEAPGYLLPYLNSEDPEVRGLAARAAGILRVEEATERLSTLRGDPSEIVLYDHGKLKSHTVGELAGEALESGSRKRKGPVHVIFS